MSVTVTNLLPDLTSALNDTIVATMESQAACAAAAIENVYNTPLCAAAAPEDAIDEMSQPTVVCDVNGQPKEVDIVKTCKARVVGEPYDEYFIPLCSDFDNQVFCIPGYQYAFAWSGVKNKDIKQFLEDNPDALLELNDLSLPAGGGDSYRAEVGGVPYACTPNDGQAPLQIEQTNQIGGGCFSPILEICPAWDGSTSDNPLDTQVSCPDLSGKTASESYYMLWADYWKCEKQDKFLRRALLGVQGLAALAGLVAAIETYNKILDKQLDIMCRVEEDNALLAACSRSLLGTDDEPGILKECQANLLAGHNDRIGTINNRGVFACTVADDEINCYEQLWRPMQKKHAPHIASELHTMLENGKFSSENSMSWADSLEECISSNMLPELKRQFAPLLSSVNCTSENLNEWRSNLKQDANELQDHFNRVYKTNEATMIPQIMEMSTCMVQRVCEMRDWLYDCARCDLDVYKKGYQSGEVPQARAAMSNAAQLIPKLVESVSWLERNIPAALNIFEACYAKEVATLNPALFDNARDLAPEIQNCFKWLKENAKEHTQFFQDCYRDRECQIVTKNLDLALKLTSVVQESLCRLDTWSQQDRGMYDLNFRDLERTKTQDLVKNGNEASNDLQDFRGWFIDRTHEFHDTYHDNWLPCDITNLKYHCDVWNKSNPLLEILDNGEMLNSMVNNNKEMYQKGIIHADTYLDTVFEEADKFDYCIEDAATHHVRKRYDQAIEEARRCTQSYAKGSLDYITTTLKAQNARDEGAAYARASRWAWWANNQLDSITHERRLSMLQYIEAIGGRMLEATNASTASYDTLLARMNEALGRGNNYLANMQDSGRAGISIMGNELDTMLRTIQQWHFWPELAQQGNVQFNAGVAQVHDQAQQLVQLGHYWPEMAFREKQEAHGIAARAIDVGVNLSQIGQYYLSQADSMNTQRANMSNQAGQLGNQFAQTGHNLHRLASDKAMNAMQQSIAAGGLGVNAGQLGAQHMSTALEIENKMTLNALEHLRAGISAMTLGVDFLGEVRQTQQLAGSYGINAATQLLNLFKHGQNNAILALNASEQCKETEFEMLCKAKDFVMENYEVTQRSLQGYSAGQLGAAQNALNAQGNNAGSAFGLLGNSLEGLLTNNSTPPFPTGGPTFGTGQFGFNGGAFT